MNTRKRDPKGLGRKSRPLSEILASLESGIASYVAATLLRHTQRPTGSSLSH